MDVSQRFAGRKLVDQAEGILMGTRQLREYEAYRVLRSTAISAKQRIGQVAQQIITQAHYAEAISRAGQMRMLSQRCMKLYALIVLGVRATETAGQAGADRRCHPRPGGNRGRDSAGAFGRLCIPGCLATQRYLASAGAGPQPGDLGGAAGCDSEG